MCQMTPATTTLFQISRQLIIIIIIIMIIIYFVFRVMRIVIYMIILFLWDVVGGWVKQRIRWI